jgi:uncharacterized membrane protein
MNGGEYRFPMGIPIVFYAILAMLTSGEKWFSHWFAVAAVVMAVLFTWQAFNRKAFDTIHEKDPTMNIETWRFNWILFFALPGYLIGLYGAYKYWPR